MTQLLEDLLRGRVLIDDFKSWLTSDTLANSGDKVEFISYFLVHVREKCAWLTSKNGKSVESPLKQIKPNDNQQFSFIGQTFRSNQDGVVSKTKPPSAISSPRKKTDSYIKNCSENYNRNVVPNKHFDRIKRNGLSSSLDCRYSENNRRNFQERNIRKSDYSARKSLNFNTSKDAKTTENSQNCVPDINSFDAFPPVGSEISSNICNDSKARRRITPTPIQVAQNGPFRNSKFTVPTEKVPDDVFKSTPFVETPGFDLQREREMLKITRDKLLQSSPCNSLRNLKIESNVSPKKPVSVTFIVPDPEKVSCKNELLIFSVIYDTLITNALVPNVTAELYFIFEVLTSKALLDDKPDDIDCIFCSIHNCVFFAVSVLSKLQKLLYLLDNGTLSSLCEVPYLSKFSSHLTNFLQEQCNAKEEILTKSQLVKRVPFHLEEDSRENFINDQAFSAFRKQRDLFYELLRDWQDQPLGCIDTNFREKFSRKAKTLVSLGPNAINMHHLAKLFQNQLIASCLCLEINEVCDDLLSDILKNFPGKIEKLSQRFMIPFCVGGPNPPPTFYGTQAFFCELIDATACTSLNKQLQDIFISKILDFNRTDLFSDIELNPLGSIKEKYVFLLHTLRLLGKFLGYLHFSPYKVTVTLSPIIQNSQLVSRKQAIPPIDIPKLLKEAIEENRIILTVPWIVEYLSMVDHVGKQLPFIEETLKILGAIYRGRCFAPTESNSFWFLRLILGWLFDILCYSPEYYCSNNSTTFKHTVQYKGIDLLAVIDKQLIHSCCPYLVEFKVLLYNFLNGIRNDKKREIRKITPLSTTSKPLSMPVAQQQIQCQLEENFFFVHPSSMKKTVEFVAERTASRIISKIRSEVRDFKFQTVDDIVLQETYKTLLECKTDIERKLHSYVDSFILKQYDEFYHKIMDFVNTTCLKDIDTIMPYLFSVDIKPLVLKMCCKISIRIALDKVHDWCDTNLILEDITSDIKTKLNHLSKGDADGEADSTPELSHLITDLRQCIIGMLSGSCDSLNNFKPILSSISSVINKQIGNTSRKLIAFMTVDLYIALLVHNSEICTEEINKTFISIWCGCPSNYDLEKYLLGPQNLKLLLAGKNLDGSCEKLHVMLNELMRRNVFSIEKLKMCKKNLMSYEWKDSRSQELFSLISNALLNSTSKVA